MSCFELILLATVFLGAIAAYTWFKTTSPTRPPRRTEPVSAEQGKYKLVHRSIRADGDEPFPSGNGYYVLRVTDNRRLSWNALPPGLLTFPVAGASRHGDDLQNDAFAPGSSLALVLEPTKVHDSIAIKICSPDQSLQAGYVPREFASKVGRALKRGEVTRCISLWEEIEMNRRVSLRVLIVSKGIDFST